MASKDMEKWRIMNILLLFIHSTTGRSKILYCMPLMYRYTYVAIPISIYMSSVQLARAAGRLASPC